MNNNLNNKEKVPINHANIIDGFSELHGIKHYISFSSYCGICDSEIFVSSMIQKFILEKNKVPVKFLKRGAVYCEECKDRRARINFLSKGDKWQVTENGKAELIELQNIENNLKSHSKGLYEKADWPY